jgi:hypothetical protein
MPEHKGHPLPKARYVKWKFDDLLDAIRDEIMAHLVKPVWKFPGDSVTAEGLSRDYLAPIPLVNRCLMKLNQEGVLYQRESHPPDERGGRRTSTASGTLRSARTITSVTHSLSSRRNRASGSRKPSPGKRGNVVCENIRGTNLSWQSQSEYG